MKVHDAHGCASQSPRDTTLDLSEFVPFYVRSIANKLAQAASRTYKERYGIGLNEWSCIAALAAEPRQTASQICSVSGFDKALVSRSLHALEEKHLVAAAPDAGRPSRRQMQLTPAGEAMYREIRQLALDREDALMRGFTLEERGTVLGLLKRMHRNVTEMTSPGPERNRPDQANPQ